MKVLIGCEHSGVIRRAFRALGHHAYSCDLLPADDGSPFHYRRDVFEVLENQSFDLLIAHPPCTRLCVSGARWFSKKRHEQVQAVEFFMRLALWSVPMIAIENPIGVMSSRWRKPDQIIQPWQFGHPECKATCLWLKGLPPLKATRVVRSKMLTRPRKLRHRIHFLNQQQRANGERSISYTGIAAAMASQWGIIPIE